MQGEALRLAYVALTRARHQTVLHWASTWDSRQSPLARLLFASELAPDAVELAAPPDESDVVARIQAIAARRRARSAIERDQRAGRRPVDTAGAEPDDARGAAVRPHVRSARGVERPTAG